MTLVKWRRLIIYVQNKPAPMLHLFPSKKAIYLSPDERYGLDMESSKRKQGKARSTIRNTMGGEGERPF